MQTLRKFWSPLRIWWTSFQLVGATILYFIPSTTSRSIESFIGVFYQTFYDQLFSMKKGSRYAIRVCDYAIMVYDLGLGLHLGVGPV